MENYLQVAVSSTMSLSNKRIGSGKHHNYLFFRFLQDLGIGFLQCVKLLINPSEHFSKAMLIWSPVTLQ
jgi:hypothetical protein